ncbi:hypothetical protein B0I35DRAFT_357012 [Stachybotrys elegans]|uniref:Glycosyltransferase family 28 N-terminal domain-containing protein n=1 Tax=Stachybotrys elegans TaxID=80388 RepID=A0A8K0WPD0_9HYPO|nr:hypothetical protein B0I35DRAFT_357012 [Stachybotrys elegans]
MTVLTNASGQKPHLVFCAAPHEGHTLPLLTVASTLAKRGWTLDFVLGEQFRDRVEAIGSTLSPIPDAMTPERMAVRNMVPMGLPRVIYDLQNIFIERTEERWLVLRDVLAKVRESDPSREVIIVTEPFFMGANPMLYGAPLPKGWAKRPRVVSLGIAALLAFSIDVGPVGMGLLPDSSKAGRKRNQLLQLMVTMGPMAQLIELQHKILEKLGATDFSGAVTDATSSWYYAPDALLQLCPRSLEFERSDMPPNVEFVGWPVATTVEEQTVRAMPSWWDDVMTSGRKIVMVSQGTVQLDYTDLVVPTMRALANRDDVYTVVVLGAKGATLPDDVEMPDNVRVVDYFPYDMILAHADVFVMNAGYGGMMHGVLNGVPMVFAGATEDKPDVAARGEWAGIAVNLDTGKPSEKQVGEAVQEILTNDRYKKRVAEIRQENEELRTLDRIEKHIIAQSMA